MGDDLTWLRVCVAENIQQLTLLHLEGGPPAETTVATCAAWLRVMKSWPIDWNEALDKPRLDAAFLALAGQASRWPAPSDLRKLLPARQYPQPALPAVDYPPEKAKQNLKRIKAMIAEAFNIN